MPSSYLDLILPLKNVAEFAKDALASGAITDPGPADRMYQRVAQITGADPMPYGIAQNRAMIDQLIRYAVDQKILGKPVTAEDIFAAGTHDLTA